MRAGRTRLYCTQGDDFDPVLIYKIDGVAVDITGATARLQIREFTYSPDDIITLTTENGGIEIVGPEGALELWISGDTTAGFDPGEYVFSIRVVLSGGKKTLLSGDFIVEPSVTQ